MPECPQCNHPVQSDDRFCENCGFELQQAQEHTQSTTGPFAFELPPSIGSWKTLRWFLGGGIVVLLIACFVLYWAYGVFQRGLRGPERVREIQQVQVVVTATPPPVPTDTPGPSPTLRPTDTPAPTETPRPTNTPTSTPTPPPTTVPGTVLEPGDTWYEDDLALQMRLVAIESSALHIDLVLKNLGTQRILAEAYPDNFRMVSNLGDVVLPHHSQANRLSRKSQFYREVAFSLDPGEQIDLARDGRFEYNLANREVTHVFVEVVELARIESARWRVEIPH